MRWYDPATQTYLLTYDEQQDGRISEQGQRIAAAALADLERDARIAEQSRRIAAESQADLERDARLAAEAETQRLRDEIARLRGDGN